MLLAAFSNSYLDLRILDYNSLKELPYEDFNLAIYNNSSVYFSLIFLSSSSLAMYASLYFSYCPLFN